VDGQAANIGLGCYTDNAFIDRSGRYVSVTLSAGPAPIADCTRPIIWDLQTGMVAQLPVSVQLGEMSYGNYLDTLNGYSEAFRFVLRPLASPGAPEPILTSPGAPPETMIGIFKSWNNALASPMPPFLADSLRYPSNTDPWGPGTTRSSRSRWIKSAKRTAAGGTAAGGQVAASGLLLKFVAGGVLGLAVAGGIAVASRSGDDTPTGGHQQSAQSRPLAILEPATTTLTATSAPIPTVAETPTAPAAPTRAAATLGPVDAPVARSRIAPSAPSAPVVTVAATTPSAIDDSPGPAPAPCLAAETAALDVARSSLRSGQPADALHRLDEYARTFPGGVLAPEAAVLGIESLVRSATRLPHASSRPRSSDHSPAAPSPPVRALVPEAR
jgi:hypothetical protein